MSTSAHECKSYLANNVARDIANSLFQKWAVKGFFTESPCRVLSLVLSFASKESTAPSGRQPHRPRRSRRVKPQQREVYAHGRTRELSSGQTIGAVRTAVRPACYLPELRVANLLGTYKKNIFKNLDSVYKRSS